jgi:pyruvate ferredoxin oxidoreductase gamma subunit
VKEIRLREPVLEPDAVIIQDPTLLHQVDLFKGLSEGGYILINSTRTFSALGLGEFTRRFNRFRLRNVPATEIALKHVGRALPNVPLLGAFAAISGQIRIESVLAAIRGKFPSALAQKNAAAAIEAFELVSVAEATADA